MPAFRSPKSGRGQFGKSTYTGVILKDLARTATIVKRVHLGCALDPSQAQDDAIVKRGDSNEPAIPRPTVEAIGERVLG
jgi:hypothetical protein